MKKIIFLFGFLYFGYLNVQAQVKQTNINLFQAKEFSKEVSLFKAKTFLFREVLESTDDVLKFVVIPLAAANSGELTTLLYRCETKDKEGLILGFYGNYWNENGVVYQGYGFKNLPKKKAIGFLDKIENSINGNKEFLKDNNDESNIVFRFDDMDVLIWSIPGSYRIRVYWNNFDSTWEENSFKRSRRRFERKINK